MATTVPLSGVQYSGIWTMQQVNAAVAAGTWTGLPQLYSWGNGTAGALGLGSTAYKSSPNQIGALTTWLTIAGGYQFTAAIKTDGTLWTWGKNNYGQLGLNNTTSYSSPKQVGALTAWASLGLGSDFMLATKTDGSLWSWGRNQDGALGLNNITSYSSPKQVGALTTWSSVSASGSSTFAIKTDGTLWSWGFSGTFYGMLGLGNTTAYSSPKQIGALTTWSKVSAGDIFAAAIKTDGTLWTWGGNPDGQLGLGNITYFSSPKQVGALTTWATLGNYLYSAVTAIKTDGTLWTWGNNTYGQLGLGNVTSYSSPKQVGALTTWSKVQCGFGKNIASKTDGTLWSWGAGNYGMLGLGNTTSYSSPKQIGSLTTWSRVSGGLYHVLAIATT